MIQEKIKTTNLFIINREFRMSVCIRVLISSRKIRDGVKLSFEMNSKLSLLICKECESQSRLSLRFHLSSNTNFRPAH